MMRTRATDPKAVAAYALVEGLQRHFVARLDRLSRQYGEGKLFEAVAWLRNEGRFGGGERYEARDSLLYNQASVNVSQVHYEGDTAKRLASATAISAIVHPENPHAPSMHMHISWTQMKNGDGYWRIMADLNPSLPDEREKRAFLQRLEEVAGEYFEAGVKQGERYFYIPALGRHRGVAHFYLEGFDSGDFDNDLRYAEKIGITVIDTYADLVEKALIEHHLFSEIEKSQQLAYHTLYLFQVLTLDRGTTSGLLVHDENDIGILGSLPKRVDLHLLAAWREKVPQLQTHLIDGIVSTLKESGGMLDASVRKRLAKVVREHYGRYPQALKLQASGDMRPPTVENHR